MAPRASLITLTTDFGLKDPFVGIMKAVILSVEPAVRIVDITHEIGRHDVEEALYVLSYAHRYFPAGTIHVAVVDPGVGTERRPLLVQAAQGLFLAPDNGLLSFLFQEESSCTVRILDSDQYFRKPVSRTFHGRDIFAPAAAWLARDVQPEQMGPVVTDYVRLNIPQLLISGQAIRAEVIHVDVFGNLVTNVEGRHVEALAAQGGTLCAEAKGVQVRGLYSAYGENPSGQPGLILNSFDLLEIFCYRCSAAQKTGLGRGDRVQITVRPPAAGEHKTTLPGPGQE